MITINLEVLNNETVSMLGTHTMWNTICTFYIFVFSKHFETSTTSSLLHVLYPIIIARHHLLEYTIWCLADLYMFTNYLKQRACTLICAYT